MIDLAACAAVILVNALMQASPDYPEMVCSYISIALTFSIFANFVVLSLTDRVLSAKKRYARICFMYIVLMLNGILAVFYFSGYMMDYFITPVIILTVIYGSIIAAFVATKYIELKQAHNYGQTYVAFLVAEILLTVALILIDAFETTAAMIMHPWLISLVILLFACLSAINLTRKWFEPYWYHKVILTARLSMLADSHKMDVAVVPPKREIENDAILREARFVLAKSFIRPLEVNRLTKYLHDLMIKTGYKKEVAVSYAAMLSQTLIINLMKRKHDFSYVPNFLLSIFDKPHRLSKDNRRKQL